MKLHYQIDLLLGGIVFSVLVTTLAPAGSTRLQPLGGRETTLPLTLSLIHQTSPIDPPPDIYKALGDMGRIVIGQHQVKPNDSLERLAKTYNSSADSLRSTNRMDSPYLSSRKVVIVHNGKGMLHQVREEKGKVETLQRIANRYNQSIKKIMAANRLPGVALLSESALLPGKLLFIPDARLRFSDYELPVAWTQGKRFVSSGFGMRRHPIYRTRRFHTGWDMPRPYGTSVKSSREGTVIFAGWRGSYGRLVIVKHAGGLRTWYGHLSEASVTAGQKVKKGQLLGRVGSSGAATGPHLHFEVRDRYGNSLNPKKFLL